MDISKRLKDIRQAKDISVYKLSQLSGVSETHIRDLERGDKNPSIETLFKLSVPLDISLPELLNETGEVSYLTEKEKTLVECFRHLSDDKADTFTCLSENTYVARKKTVSHSPPSFFISCDHSVPAPSALG